jgi:hypothetical protein
LGARDFEVCTNDIGADIKKKNRLRTARGFPRSGRIRVLSWLFCEFCAMQ